MAIDLVTIDWAAISAISTIVIAALGYAISKNIKDQERQRERYTVLAEYRKEVIAFSARFFEIVAELIAIYDLGHKHEKNFSDACRLAARLSSLVDEGRFLFPNDTDHPNNYGSEKGPGYEGARRPALDAIMAAHFAAVALSDSEKMSQMTSLADREIRKTNLPRSDIYDPSSVRSILVESRRCFVNAVFPSTFPREWQSLFHDLLGPVKKSP
jgi:hypothetical protein